MMKQEKAARESLHPLIRKLAEKRRDEGLTDEDLLLYEADRLAKALQIEADRERLNIAVERSAAYKIPTLEEDLQGIAGILAPAAATGALKTEAAKMQAIAGYCVMHGITLTDSEQQQALAALEQAAAERIAQTPAYVPQMPTANGQPNTGLICLADVEPEAVSWLWYPYIPKGKITAIQGDPGSGKTYLTAALAAIVSTGAPFPEQGEEPREPGTVIFQNGEDGLADTIVPRLIAQGANLKKIQTLDETDNPFTLQDLERLDAALERIKPDLMIIDPLQAYLGAGVNMNQSNETRPIMKALAALAEKHQTAIIIVQHMNKGSGGNALYRNLGSIDFAAVYRSMLLVGNDKTTEGQKLIVQIKSSLAPAGVPLGFRIDNKCLEFTGAAIGATESDILQPAQIAKDSSSLQEAANFIMREIEPCPRYSRDLEDSAMEFFSISKKTLQKAKTELAARGQIVNRKAPGVAKWYSALSSRTVLFEADGRPIYAAKEPEEEPTESAQPERLQLELIEPTSPEIAI